ncbi:LPXTG cell wall anchor domain-containing protein [Streptomyces sp. NPDC047072]|uniref:LPXTG cell wall anchor domain-containing protein n=1 Tax=Streptomyces sp. NPDC047072 TaxID=3154809 RepID=UPI0033E5F7AA
MKSPSSLRGRRVAGVSAVAMTLAITSPAAAAGTSATGPEGQKLTVSTSSGLDPAGETVTVSGSGYNTEKGIYVAFCVDNGAGKTPTPCIGGVDMSGESGASRWISSNPPSYGEGLAKPYGGSGHKGTFSVKLTVRAKDANTDCTKSGVTCAVITRNDHTRGGDQTQTVRIPVTFAGASGAGSGSSATSSATAGPGSDSGPSEAATKTESEGATKASGPLASTGSATLTVGLTAAGLVAAGTGTWYWARRRRTA